MTEVTNELIYEVLKKIQADMTDVKKILADHGQQLIGIRKDIHALRGDDLRRESMQAQMDVRLDRIEQSLNMTDA